MKSRGIEEQTRRLSTAQTSLLWMCLFSIAGLERSSQQGLTRCPRARGPSRERNTIQILWRCCMCATSRPLPKVAGEQPLESTLTAYTLKLSCPTMAQRSDSRSEPLDQQWMMRSHTIYPISSPSQPSTLPSPLSAIAHNSRCPEAAKATYLYSPIAR